MRMHFVKKKIVHIILTSFYVKSKKKLEKNEEDVDIFDGLPCCSNFIVLCFVVVVIVVGFCFFVCVTCHHPYPSLSSSSSSSSSSVVLEKCVNFVLFDTYTWFWFTYFAKCAGSKEFYSQSCNFYEEIKSFILEFAYNFSLDI